MKKLIFILVALLFAAVSCQKADIRPNSNDNSCELCEENTLKSNGEIDDSSTRNDDTGGTITDPNNDEDEDKKKRKS